MNLLGIIGLESVIKKYFKNSFLSETVNKNNNEMAIFVTLSFLQNS